VSQTLNRLALDAVVAAYAAQREVASVVAVPALAGVPKNELFPVERVRRTGGPLSGFHLGLRARQGLAKSLHEKSSTLDAAAIRSVANALPAADIVPRDAEPADYVPVALKGEDEFPLRITGFGTMALSHSACAPITRGLARAGEAFARFAGSLHFTATCPFFLGKSYV
jgi:hypothetical protein